MQARDPLSEPVAALEKKWVKVATMLGQTEADILAFYAFPTASPKEAGRIR